MRKLQDAECEEATEETKPWQRHGPKRRTRAAEVHNLSERVRSESNCASKAKPIFRKAGSYLINCSYSVIGCC
jgi:hypothetical protein